LDVGVEKVTVACPLLAVADPMVGALGTAAGTAPEDAADAGPVPMALVAVTVKVYVVPLVRPDTVHVVAPVVVQTLPPGEEVTRYPVMGSPPLDPGAFQDTTDWVLAKEVAVTPVGAPGAVGTSTALEGSEDGPVPSPLVAVTVKV
jgi:hypothetical protein